MLSHRRELLKAFNGRDAAYDGAFVTAVTTTGIFCRPTCPARRPKPEHVRFFTSSADALAAGYRPCRRCTPLGAVGAIPTWLAPLLQAVEQEPMRRWRDSDLRRLGLSPPRIARWFKQHHGVTFHAYSRQRRLGGALGQVRKGRPVITVAGEAGYESLSAFGEAFRKFAGTSPRESTARTVVHVTRVDSPVGPLVVGVTDTDLVLLEFADRQILNEQIARIARRLRCVFTPGETPLLERVCAQLGEYFAGTRNAFDLPLAMSGTPFQQTVWRALLTIPYGQTWSYKQLAEAIGQPSAVRAVALANGANRIAILIPCHRVIGADGSLTGYGGGLWRKQRLLDLERGAPRLL